MHLLPHFSIHPPTHPPTHLQAKRPINLAPIHYLPPSTHPPTTGVELAAKDPAAVLIFSGGQTRADAGPKSEGVSYFNVAEHFEVGGLGGLPVGGLGG